MFQILKKHSFNTKPQEHRNNGDELFFGSGSMLFTIQALLQKSAGNWYATVHIFMFDIFDDHHSCLVARADGLAVTERTITPLPLTLANGKDFVFSTRYYPDPKDKQHYEENYIGFWFQHSPDSADIQLVSIENTDISSTSLVGVRHIILTDPPMKDSSKTKNILRPNRYSCQLT